MTTRTWDTELERECKAAQRLRKRSYEVGYQRLPYTGDLDEHSWCEGLWQSYADTGDYDLTPKPADTK